jgi:uncharacterized membrane protein
MYRLQLQKPSQSCGAGYGGSFRTDANGIFCCRDVSVISEQTEQEVNRNERCTIFLIGLAITLASALVVVMYLRRPLKTILDELCGTVERAEFWLAFSNVTLTLVPVIFALNYRPENQPLIFAISSQLERALVGLTGSVVVLGLVLSRFISRRIQSSPAQA